MSEAGGGSREISVAVPWGKMAGICYGNKSSQYKVLLCHGRRDNANTFALLMDYLPRDKYYYICLDLPGNGKSDEMPRGFPLSLMFMVVAVKCFVNALEWKEFIYIGHSMGSMIGDFYNTIYPGELKAIVHLDPAITMSRLYMTNMTEYFDFYLHPHYDNYQKRYESRAGTAAYTREQAVERMSSARGIPKEAADVVCSRNMVKGDDNMYRFNWDPRTMTLPHVVMSYEYYIQLVIKHPIPTLVINASIVTTGYQPGFEHVPGVFNALSRRLERYTVVTVDGNHDIQLSSPTQCARHINSFLDTLTKQTHSKL